MKLFVKILIGSIIFVATPGLAVGLYFIFKNSDPVTSNTGSNDLQNPTNPNQPPTLRDGKICNSIILDAGSSKTEIFVYEWECRDKISIPKIKQVGNDVLNPGLSADNDEKIMKYMDDLLKKIDKLFTSYGKGEKEKTPIILAATGGVRGLTKTEQNKMFRIIFDKFRNSGFLFSYNNWARVISGKEEGAFLWIAMNQLQNNFQTDSNLTATPPLKTIVLDLGGASTQIAFEANFIQELASDFENLGIVRNKQFSVFSKSFQNYGNDKAREGVKVLFDQKGNKYESGCFNSGVENITNIKFQISDVIGLSNPDDCLQKIDKYLAINNTCDTNIFECSINGSKIPKIPAQNSIFAVSGFNNVMDFFKFDGEFKPSQLLNRSKEFCRLNYTEAIAWKNETETKYFPRMCFMGLYSAQLLIKGYHIDSERTIHANELIDNIKTGWTFGLALDFASDKQCDDFNNPQCTNSKGIYLNETLKVEAENVVLTGSDAPDQTGKQTDEQPKPLILRRLRFTTTHEKLT